ncbi:MAG: spermidine/putrescine ABC transporter ATP-binding protein, partial [Staphylococcus equorum]|nr:spermidine/putrescine ABC transporter ATP-binding protein [Staphylococcus equorum]
MNPLLSFNAVSKAYDDTPILDKINIDIESGHFYTLLGPS